MIFVDPVPQNLAFPSILGIQLRAKALRKE